MPETYAECIDRFRIGPEPLACGLATWTSRAVITPDVNQAPEREPWRRLAAEHAYRGVWSFSPSKRPKAKVVGTLALYLGSPRGPTARDRELAAVITRAAAIIISNAQEAEERQRAEQADGSRSRMLCAGASMSGQTAVEYRIGLGPRAQ